MTERIFGFKGDHFFLSNFFVEYDGKTGEHRFQAAKAGTDDWWRRKIMDAPTPSKAKYWGRTVPLRADWEDVKIGVMTDLVREKFRNTDLRLRLFATGEAELVEANTWNDRFWGTDMNGVGENHLGRIIMECRDRLLGQVIVRLRDPEQAASVAPFAAAYLDAVRG